MQFLNISPRKILLGNNKHLTFNSNNIIDSLILYNHLFIYLSIYALSIIINTFDYYKNILLSLVPSRLGQQNTLTASLQMGKTPTKDLLDMTLKIWWWGSSNTGALGNAEHPFIAIAPRFILSRNGSPW